MKDRSGRWLHAAAALAITVVVCVGGYFREVWQHDLDLTWHQLVEGVSWTVGSLVGVFVSAIVIAVVMLWTARRRR